MVCTNPKPIDRDLEFGDVVCYESCAWRFVVLGTAEDDFISHWTLGYGPDGCTVHVWAGHIVAMGLLPRTTWPPGRLADITVGPMYHFTDL